MAGNLKSLMDSFGDRLMVVGLPKYDKDIKNPFIGDSFFLENPDKILGIQTIEKGRFGSDMIKVKGSIDDISLIDAEPVAVVDLLPVENLSVVPDQQIINEVFKEEMREQISKTKRLKSNKPATDNRIQQDVYDFNEINELYNKQISREELEAYYFTHLELNHKLLFDKYQYTKEDLIQKGLICYDNDAYVYLYTYQSGNISKKISNLKRDRVKIDEIRHGQYDRQMTLLEAVRPKQKGFVGDERIILLPHSNFSKQHKISELRYGKPELNGETTIFNAFKQWLQSIPPDNFKKSNYREIIDYYLDNKSLPVNKDASKEQQAKQEKLNINIRQRTKEEGDELFAGFLAEELMPEDQAKVAFFWNEKYNSIAEPNLNKVPVCFKISKTFKAGAPFMLNPTQRQAVAFMMEKFSGLFAYGVGVGKTAASIACASQAFYNGLATKMLFVVPTNTYDKWIGEIQGYTSKETGEYMQGLLPQLPQVQGIFNLNPGVVRDTLKIYSALDEKTFDHIQEVISIVKKIDAEDFTADQKKGISSIYPVNFNGLQADYNNYLATTKSVRSKSFVEYVIEYLKDEYNYLIYSLGSIKQFPEGTIFVTTEVGLQRLGVSEQNNVWLTSRLYAILSQGENSADDNGRSNRQKEIAALELKIEQIVSSSMKNARLNIEDFGFDWVCFDESHLYKKLFTFVKGQVTGEKEDADTGMTKNIREKTKYEIKAGSYPSSRALSAFVLSHYIQSTNKNRNVIQLTATPFTNSPLEVFSMLTLTNYKALEDMGLDNMVDFFDTFMRINYDIKYTPQKTVVKDVVLTGYNNLSQLRQVIYSLMDKKDEGANLKRPNKIIYPSIEKGIETTLPMTSEQEELMRDVKRYIQGDSAYDAICQQTINDEVEAMDFDGLDNATLVSEWERTTQKEFDGDVEALTDSRRESLVNQIKNVKISGLEMAETDLSEEESAGVRILRGLSMMRQITLSPYLYHKGCSRASGSAHKSPGYLEYIKSSPKLEYVMGCIKSVIDFHKSRNQKVSGQVIYMNAGIEYFPLIKEYAVKELHLRDNQVGIVSGGMSKNAKENIKNQFLSGDILILIGSSTISVGVDLQNNATALYNCYYDWNPTDAAQIEGRIWRQGNRFANVRIVYPQCYNSADLVIFEYLNSKTLRINEIWNRSSEIQELDLRDFNPKELQKKLITDPEELADWEILEQTDAIQSQIIFFENRVESLENAMKAFNKVNKLRPVVIGYLNQLNAVKLSNDRQKAIDNQKEKINELTEKYINDPAKLHTEILNYKEKRYDYESDPEGKYTPVDYSTVDTTRIINDAKKWEDLMDDWYYRESEIWGDLYYDRRDIQNSFRDFRFNYKDMRSSEERIMKPLGLSFDADNSPLIAFGEKITDLRAQLDLIDAGRPERISRIKAEMASRFKNIATIQDRINEFAAANEKYLNDILLISAPDVPKPAPPTKAEIIMPVSEEKIKDQSIVKTDNTLEKYDKKDIIKKQINALNLALKYAASEDKPGIEKQINALTISLKYI